MKKDIVIKTGALLVVCFFSIASCSRDNNIRTIKTGYNAHEYIFESSMSILSFIKDSLPNKTYLAIVDMQTKKIKSYHFADYGLDGPHAIFNNSKQVIACSTCVRSGLFNKKILLINLEGNRITNEVMLPAECGYITIAKPRWADAIYILLKTTKYEGLKQHETILFKTFNMRNSSISDSELIGSFIVKNALFMENSPYLLLDVVDADKPSLFIYDLNSRSIIHRFATITNFLDMREAKDNVVYGLIQTPGDNKGRVVEIDVMNKSYKDFIELTGHLETMLIVNDSIFVISKDLSRADEQYKYWLHPRNLYIINPQTRNVVDIIDWTQRLGRLLVYNKYSNELYYAVTDADRPALWVIANNIETLEKVHFIIK